VQERRPDPTKYYIYCYARRGWLVPKPERGSQRTGDIADYDYSVETRYVSQVGTSSSAVLAPGQQWGAVMLRLEAEFTRAVPRNLQTGWFESEKPSGRCKSSTKSYDEIVSLMNGDNDAFLDGIAGSNGVGPRRRIEYVQWTPAP
jgi:hypothetical protein